MKHDMRYALYFEFQIAEAKKVWERNEKIEADRVKNPNKYPKNVFPPQGHLFGEPAGFYIVEGTQEQVFYYTQAWMGLKKFIVEPIADADNLPNMARKAHNLE